MCRRINAKKTQELHRNHTQRVYTTNIHTHKQYTTNTMNISNNHTQGGYSMNTSITHTQYTNAISMSNAITPDLFTRWAAFIDAAPKSIETYKRNIKPFMLYMQDNGITHPKREDVIAYRDMLKADHKATTVNAYLIAVKLFFQWLEAENIYPNITAHVKACKLDTAHKKDPLTAKQVGRLFKGIDTTTLTGKRDYAILALMVTSGLRDVEVSRANIEDVRNVADFTALFIQGKGHEEKGDLVKVVGQVEEAISDYLTARGKTAGTSPLFVSHAHRNEGERLTTRSISRIVKTRLQAAGLDSDRLTAHSLRHTAATLNLLNGATLEETQQLLRHKNINTTMIYSHALQRANNNSEERIAAAIFG